MSEFKTKIQKPSAYTLAVFDSLDSTNDEMRRFTEENPSIINHVICAKEQTKGRGRRGRTWVSEKGNLFCTILSKPNVDLSKSAQISFVAALSILHSLKQLISDDDVIIQCKWPNDVLVDGYKISGILLESNIDFKTHTLNWIMCGIGINICHSPTETLYPTGFLNAYCSKNVSPETLLNILLQEFDKWLHLWEQFGFQTIKKHWLQNAKGLNQQITVNLSHEKINGIFETLDDDGCLVLRTGNGIRLITAGDVFYQ